MVTTKSQKLLKVFYINTIIVENLHIEVIVTRKIGVYYKFFNPVRLSVKKNILQII